MPDLPKLRRQKAVRQGTHRPEQDRAFVQINRKRVYLGKYADPQTHARYHQLMAQLAQAPGAEPDDLGQPDLPTLTVTELCLRFFDHAECYYRLPDGTQTTEVRNIKVALRAIRELYSTTPAETFGPLALQRVRDRMIEMGWCRSNINKNIDRIRRMFKWAASIELLDAEIWHRLRAVEGLKRGRTTASESEPVRPVPGHLIDIIQPHVSRQIWAMVQLQRLTGMRSGEVIAMRPVDIEFNESTDGAVWLYRPRQHKTQHHGHERVVPLGPQAQAVIRPFLANRSVDAQLFSPREAELDRRQIQRASRVTPQSCGNGHDSEKLQTYIQKLADQYSPGAYRRAIKRALQIVLPDPEELEGEERRHWRKQNHWHPHQLRHTYATEIRRKFGIEACQVLLGHKRADVTQIYAERDLSTGIRVASEVG